MDVKIFWAINLLAGRSFILDKIMILISNRIRYVYLLIIIILWFKKKMTIEVVVSMLIAFVTNSVIKLFYFKPRPFIKRRIGLLIPSKRDSSFPSKHTILVFAVSTSVFLYQRILGSIMLVLSFLTGLSRIWVGHHYPSDIVGSAVLGSFSSMLLHKLSLFDRSKEIGERR
jgi:undecaprenyl-diphosphatase